MATDLIDSARLLFLRELTRDVVEACRVRPGTTREGLPANVTGRTLFAAAGGGYPAFWLEDFTFALDCGLITTDEVRDMLELTFEAQQGPETRHLDSGARVPPFQIPDHVLFDAGAVYFAGTYSSGPDQGGGMWGNLPELDDNFHVAQAVSWYFQQTRDIGFLTAAINDMPVIERLERAFYVPPYDPETQLIRVSRDERGTNWGFVDTIAMTGDLLFCSLLRMRAADRLATFFSALHGNGKAAEYQGIAETIKSSIPAAFGTDSGWLLAATGRCRQHDVWGTVFALYEDALSGEVRERALAAVLDAYNNGTATFRGNVRHVLTSDVVRRAVIHAGPTNGQAQGHVDQGAELHQLQGGQHLVVVHAHHPVHATGRVPPKGRLGRHRTFHLDSEFPRIGASRPDVFQLLRAQHAALSRVGVEPTHGDARLRQAQPLHTERMGSPDHVEHSLPGDSRGDLRKRHVGCDQGGPVVLAHKGHHRI